MVDKPSEAELLAPDNLQPLIDGDVIGQEAEGYRQGKRDCMYGQYLFGDGIGTTPFLTGYDRGWKEASDAGLRGTVPIKRQKEYMDREIIEREFGPYRRGTDGAD